MTLRHSSLGNSGVLVQMLCGEYSMLRVKLKGAQVVVYQAAAR